MRACILGSGSQGNAILLETGAGAGASRVLIDAGFPPRTIAARLKAVGVRPESIEACLVTHEHGDHIRGAAACARRWGWTLHASRGTVDAWPALRHAGAIAFAPGARLHVGDWDIDSARVSHDASEPVAYCATVRRSGARIGLAYDLGVATAGVRRLLERVDVLVLEANHDEVMLRTGPYPAPVKARIASPTGHLSNRQAGELARALSHAGLRRIVLAHLSEVNNTPEQAAAAIGQAMRGLRARPSLDTAGQRTVLRIDARGRGLDGLAMAADAHQLPIEF